MVSKTWPDQQQTHTRCGYSNEIHCIQYTFQDKTGTVVDNKGFVDWLITAPLSQVIVEGKDNECGLHFCYKNQLTLN